VTPGLHRVGGHLRESDKHCRSRGGLFDYLSKGGNISQDMPMWSAGMSRAMIRVRLILIEARQLNDAMQVATKFPMT